MCCGRLAAGAAFLGSGIACCGVLPGSQVARRRSFGCMHAQSTRIQRSLRRPPRLAPSPRHHNQTANCRAAAAEDPPAMKLAALSRLAASAPPMPLSRHQQPRPHKALPARRPRALPVRAVAPRWVSAGNWQGTRRCNGGAARVLPAVQLALTIKHPPCAARRPSAAPSSRWARRGQRWRRPSPRPSLSASQRPTSRWGRSTRWVEARFLFVFYFCCTWLLEAVV